MNLFKLEDLFAIFNFMKYACNINIFSYIFLHIPGYVADGWRKGFKSQIGHISGPTCPNPFKHKNMENPFVNTQNIPGYGCSWHKGLRKNVRGKNVL